MNLFAKAAVSWPPLVSGTLIRRYHRFLADVAIDDGKTVTAHCPNSGSMKGCSAPGRPVYLSIHDALKRKLKYTWELIRMPDSLVGVNTLLPNRLVYRAVKSGALDAFKGYDRIIPEVRVSASRIDLLLESKSGQKCFVEVKNCTWVQNGVAAFPDAVTQRGRKHLNTLRDLVQKGHRGVCFFLIQRMDASSFTPADWIDPAYGETLRTVHDAGVEILAYDVTLNLRRIALNAPLPCRL